MSFLDIESDTARVAERSTYFGVSHTVPPNNGTINYVTHFDY